MGRDNFVPPYEVDILGDVLGGPRAHGPVQVPAAKINTTGGTQMRAGLDDSTVFEYGQTMIHANGWGTFPPVIAYHDGKDYWLADGFHRVAAFLESFPDPKRRIPVEVRAGTRRDAVLHAAGANASHGLRRTNQDKRRAVETLLRDEEWAAWSNTEIARRCVVSESTVRNIRAELEKASQIAKVTDRKGADGKTYNTANIGSRPAPVPAKPVYTPVTIAGNSEPTPGTPIPQRGAVLNTPAAEAPAAPIVTPDELEVVASVTAPWEAPVDDEEITSPLDCYDDDETPDVYEGFTETDQETFDRLKWPRRMRDLHELKMWLKTTRDQKVKEYQKLTGREIPALFTGSIDHMIAVLEHAMDATEKDAVTNANQ